MSVGYPISNTPSIHRKIDGPMLVMRNGECHFHTWRERIAYFFGLVDAVLLEQKYRPQLARSVVEHHLIHSVHDLLGALWELHDWPSREAFDADPSVKHALSALRMASSTNPQEQKP